METRKMLITAIIVAILIIVAFGVAVFGAEPGQHGCIYTEGTLCAHYMEGMT